MPGKPKPTPLKVLEGNRGKRPLPENEPKPRPKAPECPPDLDTGARKAWRRLAPILERLGLLTELDGDTFASVVQIRSRLEKLFRRQKKVETLIRKATKALDSDEMEALQKEREWLFKEERLFLQQFRQYAAEFGLSPRGRVGLAVGVGKKDSQFGDDILD